MTVVQNTKVNNGILTGTDPITGNSTAVNIATGKVLSTVAGAIPSATPINNKTISSSQTLNTQKNIDSTKSSAVSGLTGGTTPPTPPPPTPPPAPTPTPAPTVAQPTQNTDGTWTIPAGTSPTVASYYTNANNAIANQNAQNQINQQRTAQLNANIQQLQNDKAKEIAAITEEAGVGSSDSGENTTLTSSIGNISAKYDQAISEATAEMNVQQQQDTLNNNIALQNIQSNLSTNIQTNQQNNYTQAMDIIKNVKAGDTDLTSEEQNSLYTQLVSSGMSPDSANLEVQSAIQVGKIANDKTTNAQTKTEQTESIGLLKSSLANVTDVNAAANDPVLINLALKSGAVGNPAGYDAQGNSLFSTDQIQKAKDYITTQTKGTVAAQNAQKKEQDAIERLSTAALNASTSQTKKGLDDVEKYFTTALAQNKDIFKPIKDMSSVDQQHWIATRAHMLGVDPTLVAAALDDFGVKLTDDTIKKVSTPIKIFGIALPWNTSTTTTTSKDTAGSSGANSYNGITLPN